MDSATALYRRYRPQRLADVVGQERPVSALRNSMENGRLGHFYIFSGPRGTGKTSTARILAMALNCEQPVGVEPCGVCTSCTGIISGSSYDVQELDAATNNGVDDVRALLKTVSLSSPGRKKVYIIDEAHMLTTQAGNALLKTLEEPPSHVMFIFATTDAQKLLDTILSRSQQLNFKLVSPVVLSEHLERIAADAGLDVSPEMIRAAAFRGAGSVRDALSALDTIVASGMVEEPTSSALVQAIASADVLEIFKAIASAMQEGVDARVLAEEALASLREIFLIQMGAGELLVTPDSAERTALASEMGPRRTVKAMDALGEAVLAMKGENNRRVNLEVSLARYCKQPG